MSYDEQQAAEKSFMDSLSSKLADAGMEEQQAPVEDAEPETPPVAEETAPATTEEPETPEEGETPAEEQERLYAGQYKTVEDLERAVREKEDMIQRQSGEVGELRQAKAQLDLLQQQLEWAQQQPDAEAPGLIEGMLEQGNYFQAAEYARQSNNPALYQQVMSLWSQEPDQQFNAFSYHSSLQQQAMMEQIQQRQQPQIDQTQQYVNQQLSAQAMEVVAARHEDFAQVMGTLDESRLGEITQSLPPQVLQGLNGSMEEKQAVFETLYRWVKAEQTGTLNEAAAQAVQRSQAEARDQKTQAQVASATTGTNTEQAPKPEEQQMAEQMGAEWKVLSEVASLDKAWTGRETRGTPR